ncbi:MAG: aminoglycoside phosphotransferase family protein [Acidobacteria bacterium]|nr:aminoglycoside phosphotransferase family protein [Acidobacteriota bacterium]
MTYARSGRYLVPLDSAPAVAYFRDSLYVAYSPAGRLLPRVHGVRVSAPPEVTELFDTLGEPAVPAILLLDYEQSDRAQTIAFLFRDDTPQPSEIVKVRRGSSSLRAEAAVHERLQMMLPPELRGTVPRVLDYRERDDLEILKLSTVSGRSAYVDLQNRVRPSRYVDAHFDAAAQWLAKFHDATAATHGDFWARNLLLNESGGVGVVDWELFTTDAPPTLDLFHFPLTYGLNYPWTRYRRLPPEQAFAKTFLESNRVSQAVRRYLQTYAAARGMAWTTMAPRFRAFLSEPSPRPGTRNLPWPALAATFNRANESVFSG